MRCSGIGFRQPRKKSHGNCSVYFQRLVQEECEEVMEYFLRRFYGLFILEIQASVLLRLGVFEYYNADDGFHHHVPVSAVLWKRRGRIISKLCRLPARSALVEGLCRKTTAACAQLSRDCSIVLQKQQVVAHERRYSDFGDPPRRHTSSSFSFNFRRIQDGRIKVLRHFI